MKRPTTLPVYVLAGGRHRRFGQDKARALLQGRPVIRHVVASMACPDTPVTVVADRVDKYRDLGLRTLADEEPHRGPLGGLARALEDLATTDQPWLLLASCDLLGMQSAWLDLLWERARVTPRTVSCCAFRGGAPVRWQPLPGLFHRDALALVRSLLSAPDSNRGLWRVIAAMPHVEVPLPADWDRALQINTVADLNTATARARV